MLSVRKRGKEILLGRSSFKFNFGVCPSPWSSRLFKCVHSILINILQEMLPVPIFKYVLSPGSHSPDQGRTKVQSPLPPTNKKNLFVPLYLFILNSEIIYSGNTVYHLMDWMSQTFVYPNSARKKHL